MNVANKKINSYIERITDRECTGCHACYSVCPVNAIQMNYDEEGFKNPQISPGKCIGCEKCIRTCPLNNKSVVLNNIPKTYAAINRDEIQRESSSSGGMFILLAGVILDMGGVVYGAAYDTNFSVHHKRTESDASIFKSSKYVQSSLGKCLNSVEADLRDDKVVLFSGTPCQIAGLKNFLICKKCSIKNLFLVDLICHGVPSPILWEKYLRETSKNRKVYKINFRNKSMGWRARSLSIDFEDGSKYIMQGNKDPYMRAFFENLTLRPSCHKCAFKSVNRMSDITLADFWGIEKVYPPMMDDKGTSAVIIHSTKGTELFTSIQSQIKCVEDKIETIITYNTPIITPVRAHIRRDKFFTEFRLMTVNETSKILKKNLKSTMTEKEQILRAKLVRKLKKLIR